MKMGHGGLVHRHLGQLFEGQSISGLGEVQLLERFVDRRDEPAFAALVARHGPMVLGVCRRLLADPLDVEDAFQATFLVFVRRASTLRDRDRLAPWLFGVARKVATRARVNLARRRARECSKAEEAAGIADFDDHRHELGQALIEEIDRLPGPLREAILLCCVEGLTYDEAAIELQSTAPAVRGRLARARERLRTRLTLRGFAPSAAAFGALLSAETVSAAVPAILLKTTIRASLAGAVPASVEALAEGVIRTMLLTKSKFLAAAVVACGVAGSSVGVFAQQQGAPQRDAQEADRLSQVEQKLDRVLRALENPGRTPQAIYAPVGVPAIAPTPPAVPAPPVPPVPPQPTVARAGAGTPEGMMRMFMMGGQAGQPTPSTRLEAVEQKLEQLEARIANLERRLGPERGVDRRSDYGNPGADPFRMPGNRATSLPAGGPPPVTTRPPQESTPSSELPK